MFCAIWGFMMCESGIMNWGQVPGFGTSKHSTFETASNTPNWHSFARIEVGPAELPKLLENGLSARVAEALKKIGYAHVTLDLQGYRRGSLNENQVVHPVVSSHVPHRFVLPVTRDYNVESCNFLSAGWFNNRSI